MAIQSQPEVNPLGVLLEGTEPFTEEIVIATDQRIAIRGLAEKETVLHSRSGPVLDIVEGSTVYLADLTVQAASFNPCISIRDSTLFADDVQVSVCTEFGVSAEDSVLDFRNAIIGVVGSDTPSVVIRDSTLSAQYTTFAAGLFDSPALRCTGTSEARITNSIIVNSSGMTDELDCSNLSIEHSATENVGVLGTGNIAVGSMMESWFVFYGADHRLSAEGFAVFEGIARGSADSHRDDIDGDPRPQSGPDWPGADRPSP